MDDDLNTTLASVNDDLEDDNFYLDKDKEESIEIF